MQKDIDLRVYYTGNLDEELDNAIRDCLSKFNLTQWASGYDLVNNKRDLAFEVKENCPQ